MKCEVTKLNMKWVSVTHLKWGGIYMSEEFVGKYLYLHLYI